MHVALLSSVLRLFCVPHAATSRLTFLRCFPLKPLQCRNEIIMRMQKHQSADSTGAICVVCRCLHRGGFTAAPNLQLQRQYTKTRSSLLQAIGSNTRKLHWLTIKQCRRTEHRRTSMT